MLDPMSKIVLWKSAVTEMVPKKFGPREIWSPRNLGHRKFDPKNVGPCMKMPYNDFHVGTKFLGAQIFQGPNFLGTKFLRDQISWGPKKSGAQMRTRTISVLAL